MPEELENGTKLEAEVNQDKSSVGWDRNETKRAWLTGRPLACKGVLEHKWQVKALASRWGEATGHAWVATECSCPRSQGVVAEARRQAGALVTGWYLSREGFEGEWRKIPDPWPPLRPCLSVIVKTSGGTMWRRAETRWRLCASPPTPLQPRVTLGPLHTIFTAGHASPKTPLGFSPRAAAYSFLPRGMPARRPPWGFHPGQLQNIFCLTSEACQPALF